MTSPKKNLNYHPQNTMFGQLLNIEKQTTVLSQQMVKEIELIQNIKEQFIGLQRQAKSLGEESKNKLNQEIRFLEDKIKNYLITQKAQFMRSASQINQLIQNSKELNSQLTLLSNKFDEFQKNVGI